MILLEFDAMSFSRLGPAAYTNGRPWTAFCFVPVLLHVAGIDLISATPDIDGATVADGLGLPLPEVALWGLVALHHAGRTGRSAYELNEHGSALLFEVSDEVLLVHSMLRERTVQVSYKRMLTVWEEFDQRVRQLLVQTFGRLVDYPWWNASMDEWLHGRLDLSAMKPPLASMRFLDGCELCFDQIDAVEV